MKNVNLMGMWPKAKCYSLLFHIWFFEVFVESRLVWGFWWKIASHGNSCLVQLSSTSPFLTLCGLLTVLWTDIWPIQMVSQPSRCWNLGYCRLLSLSLHSENPPFHPVKNPTSNSKIMQNRRNFRMWVLPDSFCWYPWFWHMPNGSSWQWHDNDQHVFLSRLITIQQPFEFTKSQKLSTSKHAKTLCQHGGFLVVGVPPNHQIHSIMT
jgi:hypothetical protein